MAEQLAELVKGDLEIYTEDDRIVGIYNGKPLHQKIIFRDNLSSLPSWNPAISWSSLGISGTIDYVNIVGKGYIHYRYGAEDFWISEFTYPPQNAYCSFVPGNLDLRIGHNHIAERIVGYYFTVQYTLT